MSFQRYFTVSEAEALIPRLERLMREIQALKGLLDAKVSSWRGQAPRGAATQAVAQGQVDFLISQINARLDEMVQLGCQPKDLDTGLVDFPARLDGREVHLCWKRGEPRVAFWHGLEEGFPGRKPLPVVPTR